MSSLNPGDIAARATRLRSKLGELRRLHDDLVRRRRGAGAQGLSDADLSPLWALDSEVELLANQLGISRPDGRSLPADVRERGWTRIWYYASNRGIGLVCGQSWAADMDRLEALAASLEAEPGLHHLAKPAVKTKRSTGPGEARTKIIAALTKHHKYADGSCLNTEPIGNNKLARQADVADSTATHFFNKEFGGPEAEEGHANYKVVCRDPGRLADSLKVLNGEFSPDDLYGRRPPDEGERDEDE
jgi:hypothetical protein